MALVVLSEVEQRLDAVRAVLAGMEDVEVAARTGVHRSTVHRWLAHGRPPLTAPATGQGVRVSGSRSAVELDRVVPGSGNMSLCGNQFWLGRARAGQVVRFWIDCEWMHLSIGGSR